MGKPNCLWFDVARIVSGRYQFDLDPGLWIANLLSRSLKRTGTALHKMLLDPFSGRPA